MAAKGVGGIETTYDRPLKEGPGARDYLFRALEEFPHNPSLALWRAVEARTLSGVELEPPVLDLGCGDGSFAALALKREIQAGLDLSAYVVRLAWEKGLYQSLQVADARALPYARATFQTVFSNCAVEHIPGVEGVVREVSRVLRRGGRFIFTVPTEHFGEGLFFSSILRLFSSRHAERYVFYKNRRLAHHNLWALGQWAELLAEHGLPVRGVRYYMPLPLERRWDLLDEAFVAGVGRFRLALVLLAAARRWSVKPIPPLFSWLLLRWYQRSAWPGDDGRFGGMLVVAQKDLG